MVVCTNKASIYNLIFNEFRTERIEFTKSHLQNFLKRKCEDISANLYRESTIIKDINIFLRSYISLKEKKDFIDEDFSSLFNELSLVSHAKAPSIIDGTIVDYFKIENIFRQSIHPYIFFFAILNNQSYSNSINFNDIYENESKIFAISKENTFFILNYLSNDNTFKSILNYSDTAGLKILQFKSKPDKWKILSKYYSLTDQEYSEIIKNEELFFQNN